VITFRLSPDEAISSPRIRRSGKESASQNRRTSVSFINSIYQRRPSTNSAMNLWSVCLNRNTGPGELIFLISRSVRQSQYRYPFRTRAPMAGLFVLLLSSSCRKLTEAERFSSPKPSSNHVQHFPIFRVQTERDQAYRVRRYAADRDNE
jgi:hypothetical protein